MASIGCHTQAMSSPAKRVPFSGLLPSVLNGSLQRAGTKRTRALDAFNGENDPPAKKQATESAIVRTSTRRQHNLGSAPLKRNTLETGDAFPTSNSRARTVIPATLKTRVFTSGRPIAQAEEQQLESLRQWQKHWKKLFPQYIFFFDNIPQNTVVRAEKYIAKLGGSSHKYFSNNITHFITSKDIANRAIGIPRRTVQRDVLDKAKTYGIKIWPLDKLERVLDGLLNNKTGIANSIGEHNGRSHQQTSQRAIMTQQQTDLSHLLRQEKLLGPTDRDPHANPNLIYFRGYMIYVRDLSEKAKPIIVKDYTRVSKLDDGSWPQMRLTRAGRCLWVEDSSRDRSLGPKAIAPLKIPNCQRKNLDTCSKKKTLRSTIKAETVSFTKPAIPSTRRTKEVPSCERLLKDENTVAEPTASGIQPSNITSAIRSHIVSSYRDQPGQRAGASKDILGLQRRVAGNVLLVNPAQAQVATARQRITSITTTAARRGVGSFERGTTISRPKCLVKPAPEINQSRNVPSPKPGYCENCREKYDDFKQHVSSRPHKKFASDQQNWIELDRALSQFVRPMKRSAGRVSRVDFQR